MELREAKDRAETLLKEFGVWDSGWRVVFDNAVRRAGMCNYTRRVVSLSRHMVRMNGWDEVGKTVRHEIAHALTGPGHHHDRLWRQYAQQVGAPVRATYPLGSKAMPDGRWQATCGCAGKVHHRHRRPSARRRMWCLTCGESVEFRDVAAAGQPA